MQTRPKLPGGTACAAHATMSHSNSVNGGRVLERIVGMWQCHFFKESPALLTQWERDGVFRTLLLYPVDLRPWTELSQILLTERRGSVQPLTLPYTLNKHPHTSRKTSNGHAGLSIRRIFTFNCDWQGECLAMFCM